MKKISICAFVLLMSFNVMAQNKKGNIIIGTSLGSGSIAHSTGESYYSLSPTISKNKSTSFSIQLNPSVGKFVTDDIVVGLEPGIGYYTGKTDYSNTTSSSTSTSKTHYFYPSLGAYGRFYLGKAKSSGMPFVQAGAAVNFYPGYKSVNTYSNPINNSTTTYDNYSPWNIYGRVGYEHFINTVIGLQYFIGYNHSATDYTYKVDYESSSNTDYTGGSESNGGNFQFGAGLLIHLDCSKKKK